jgi:quinol monooxygenase YgiN
MSISLILSGVGAVVAAIGIGVLMARCLRAPRTDLVAWSVALLGLLVALGAQTLGHLLGFSQLSFRAMELGAQVVAPLALIMGLTEVVGKSMAVRFAGRLFIPALGLIPLVILSVDPLSGRAFSKAWPSPELYYQLIPNKLIEYGVAPLSLLVALIAVGFALVRAGQQRQWRPVALPVAAAGAAVLILAIPGLATLLGVTLPLSTLFALLCLLAAALTLQAGVAAARVRLSGLRGGSPASRGQDAYDERDREDDDRDHDGWERSRSRAGGDQADDFDSYDDGSLGVYRDGGLYRDEPAGARSAAGAYPPGDDGYGRPGGPGGYPADGSHLNGSAVGPDGRQRGGPDLDGTYGPGGGPNGYDAAHQSGQGPGRRDPTRSELYGQIAIYTLIEDRVHEFDRLTERVVVQVRSQEPDTLVFIVHAVPSAPMQRILYEVYRDRAAFDWHGAQPYVSEFEADRRPYVLATNVIELGLQQAKVSPFPSIVDLFGEPGYDTSGFERPDYTREYGSSAGQNGTLP